MTAIPIDLPSDLRDFVEDRVKSGKFSSASEYIVSLVDAARKNRAEIEIALVEGLESGPAEEWTPREWQEIRQRVIDRRSRLRP